MRYAIIIPDGCADEPIAELGSVTPLQYAKTPNIDSLAHSSIIGRSYNVPSTMPPGSDVATLSLLGYNVADVYTGRAPLEAAAMGIAMSPDDWAFRCNTVTIENDVMKSFTADQITSAESTKLINVVGGELPKLAETRDLPIKFFAGVSYRNLMLWSGNGSPFSSATITKPPHDYTDQSIVNALPTGQGSEIVRKIMQAAHEVLAKETVNKNRIDAGKLPCTDFWLWGQGKRPDLELFAKRFSKTFNNGTGDKDLRGAMITAVDLLRGIAKLIGWDVIEVPGATGYIDTDYAAKGEYAAKALEDYDLVCVHVESPDESGHEGDVQKKVKALEDIDAKLLPPLLNKLQSYEDGWKILISPDHPTPCRTKTHSHGWVPWLQAGNKLGNAVNNNDRYNEVTAASSQVEYKNGYELMTDFLRICDNV
ncbi:MAG: cofactor-independent phosphoglycerate mutase [Planctomycetaceae bacterium]|jgi:2,3-bisphosphoglycerate-independent phosphoglycerate mutase|nr:cofactor-independent phosphoglycerate mutase [Planctomycetaceae bacterium]